MDTLVGIFIILFLLMAVAPFFLMSGAFRRRKRRGAEAAFDPGLAGAGPREGAKSRPDNADRPDSGDSVDGGGAGDGAGGGE